MWTAVFDRLHTPEQVWAVGGEDRVAWSITLFEVRDANGWVILVPRAQSLFVEACMYCRSWPMLPLLDASKHNGATCCENDSMFLLHFPLPSLAGVPQRWFHMQVLNAPWGWLMS